MPDAGRRRPWRCAVVAGAIATLVWSAADAKDSAASVKEAEQYIAHGDLKAAELELRNAIRSAPQDPVPRARLGAVYLQLGDAVSAEREARAARERNGNEADYLPVLADALLRQEKFANLIELVQPGNRDPVLESKVRTALAAAAVGVHDSAKAGTLLDEAIKLDPSAVRPKIQLARLLAGTKPAEADKLVDEAIAANPRSAEALQVKGEILHSRGDQEGATRAFDEALKIDPKNISALLSRANVYITLGKYKAADEDLSQLFAWGRVRQAAEVCPGRSHIRPHQPRLRRVLAGILCAGSDETRAGAICAGRSELGQISRPCARRHKGGPADRKRRVAAASGGAGDRIPQTIGRQNAGRCSDADCSGKCLYGGP